MTAGIDALQAENAGLRQQLSALRKQHDLLMQLDEEEIARLHAELQQQQRLLEQVQKDKQDVEAYARTITEQRNTLQAAQATASTQPWPGSAAQHQPESDQQLLQGHVAIVTKLSRDLQEARDLAEARRQEADKAQQDARRLLDKLQSVQQEASAGSALKDALEHAESTIQELQQVNAQLRSTGSPEQKAALGAISTLQDALKQAELSIKELEDSNTQLLSQRSALEGRLDAAHKSEHVAVQHAGRLQAQVVVLEQRCVAADAQLAQLQSNSGKAGLLNQLQHMKDLARDRASLHAECIALRAERDAAVQQAESLQQQLATATAATGAAMSSLQQEVSSLKAQQNQQVAAHATLRDTYKALKKQHKQLQAKYDADVQAANQPADHSEVLQRDLLRLQAELERLRDQNTDLRSRLHAAAAAAPPPPPLPDTVRAAAPPPPPPPPRDTVRAAPPPPPPPRDTVRAAAPPPPPPRDTVRAAPPPAPANSVCTAAAATAPTAAAGTASAAGSAAEQMQVDWESRYQRLAADHKQLDKEHFALLERHRRLEQVCDDKSHEAHCLARKNNDLYAELASLACKNNEVCAELACLARKNNDLCAELACLRAEVRDQAEYIEWIQSHLQLLHCTASVQQAYLWANRVSSVPVPSCPASPPPPLPPPHAHQRAPLSPHQRDQARDRSRSRSPTGLSTCARRRSTSPERNSSGRERNRQSEQGKHNSASNSHHGLLKQDLVKQDLVKQDVVKQEQDTQVDADTLSEGELPP